MIICITVEGVLVRDSQRPLFESQTINAGVEMAHALGEVATVALITSRPKLEVEPWLRARGPRHDVLVGPWSGPLWRGDPDTAQGHDRVLRVQEISTGGSRVAFCVEADPHVAASMLASGFPVMLATWPSSSIRDWTFTTEHRAPTEWSALMEEMGRQEQLTGNDEPPAE